MQNTVETHIQGFDEQLGGGIPAGSVVLLRGGPGTLKSSLAYYVLYQNARQGRPGLFVTLEQEGRALLEQMSALGMDPAAVAETLPVLDLSRGRAFFDKAREKQASTDTGDVARIVRSKIEELRKRYRFELLVVDSWDALELILEFTNRRAQTFEFFRWLRSTGITSFLTSEIGTDPDASDFSEEFLADAIFHLKLERVGELDFQRRIQCVKMRFRDHSHDYYTLIFDNGRFEVAKSFG